MNSSPLTHSPLQSDIGSYISQPEPQMATCSGCWSSHPGAPSCSRNTALSCVHEATLSLVFLLLPRSHSRTLVWLFSLQRLTSSWASSVPDSSLQPTCASTSDVCIQPSTWQLSTPTCICHRRFRLTAPQATPASAAPHLCSSPHLPRLTHGFYQGRGSEIILNPSLPLITPHLARQRMHLNYVPLSLSSVMFPTSAIISQLPDSSGLNGCPPPTLASWICCWGCLSGFCPEVLPSSLSPFLLSSLTWPLPSTLLGASSVPGAGGCWD